MFRTAPERMFKQGVLRQRAWLFLILLGLSACLILVALLNSAWLKTLLPQLALLLENPWSHAPVFDEVGTGSATRNGISRNFDDSLYPALAVSPGGLPYVAWVQALQSLFVTEIYVLHWDGGRWSEVGEGSNTNGGITNTNEASTSASIDFAPDGTLYLAWGEAGEIYVKQWDGIAWEEVGPGPASGQGISLQEGSAGYPSLAVAPNGMLYVAWQQAFDGGYHIYVLRWNGATWDEVGTGSASGRGISNTNVAVAPQLQIDSGGTPYIAWADTTTGEQLIYVRRWIGNRWEEVGIGSASGPGLGSINMPNGIAPDSKTESKETAFLIWPNDLPALAIGPDNAPYIVWPYNNRAAIAVRHWNEATDEWEVIDFSTDSNQKRTPQIAISPDGQPYIAWRGNDEWGRGIYVRRWNGRYWEEVAPGSARANGIGIKGLYNYNPVLAFGPDGTLYVAWDVGNIANRRSPEGNDYHEIYIRRWQE